MKKKSWGRFTVVFIVDMVDVFVRGRKYPGIKFNSKVVVKDNHLTLIYFTCGNNLT